MILDSSYLGGGVTSAELKNRNTADFYITPGVLSECGPATRIIESFSTATKRSRGPSQLEAMRTAIELFTDTSRVVSTKSKFYESLAQYTPKNIVHSAWGSEFGMEYLNAVQISELKKYVKDIVETNLDNPRFKGKHWNEMRSYLYHTAENHIDFCVNKNVLPRSTSNVDIEIVSSSATLVNRLNSNIYIGTFDSDIHAMIQLASRLGHKPAKRIFSTRTCVRLLS